VGREGHPIEGVVVVNWRLEFLEHHFAKVGHRLAPYDPTLFLHITAADTTHAKASAAKRLRSNGLRGSLPDW
jgi:hypothetical protein